MEAITRWVDQLAAGLGDLIPYASLNDYLFMQRALLGLLFLAPLCATIGIQVVNFRLAFFSEAVGHSVLTGIGLGLILSLLTNVQGEDSRDLVVNISMMGFGILVAMGITAYRRATSVPSDTIIGVFSAAAVALGLCAISYLAGKVPLQGIYQSLLAGNILTLSAGEIAALAVFFVVAMLAQFFTYNRMLLVGLNAELAQTRGIHVAFYDYLFAGLLAVVVMFSIQWVGVLLVTAMLVIPAATARNLARTAGTVFWWAVGIALIASVAGLIFSDLFSTTTGATIILCMTVLFILSSVVRLMRGGG